MKFGLFTYSLLTAEQYVLLIFKGFLEETRFECNVNPVDYILACSFSTTHVFSKN